MKHLFLLSILLPNAVWSNASLHSVSFKETITQTVVTNGKIIDFYSIQSNTVYNKNEKSVFIYQRIDSFKLETVYYAEKYISVNHQNKTYVDATMLCCGLIPPTGEKLIFELRDNKSTLNKILKKDIKGMNISTMLNGNTKKYEVIEGESNTKYIYYFNKETLDSFVFSMVINNVEHKTHYVIYPDDKKFSEIYESEVVLKMESYTERYVSKNAKPSKEIKPHIKGTLLNTNQTIPDTVISLTDNPTILFIFNPELPNDTLFQLLFANPIVSEGNVSVIPLTFAVISTDDTTKFLNIFPKHTTVLLGNPTHFNSFSVSVPSIVFLNQSGKPLHVVSPETPNLVASFASGIKLLTKP